MHSFLKTKASSLCLESKYIRRQEKKYIKAAKNAAKKGRTNSAAWLEKNREGQYLHRISVVRHEARLTNIARGFLCGRKYNEIERIVYNRLHYIDWSKIRGMVMAYGDKESPKWKVSLLDDYQEWVREALQHISVRKPRKQRVENAEV